MPELQHNLYDDLSAVTTESWRTFRIMAELVNALDELNNLKVNCISIFGSARCKPESKEYKDAEEIARQLVRAGYGIITGGGPGAMEALRKTAFRLACISNCPTSRVATSMSKPAVLSAISSSASSCS